MFLVSSQGSRHVAAPCDRAKPLARCHLNANTPTDPFRWIRLRRPQHDHLRPFTQATRESNNEVWTVTHTVMSIIVSSVLRLFASANSGEDDVIARAQLTVGLLVGADVSRIWCSLFSACVCVWVSAVFFYFL